MTAWKTLETNLHALAESFTQGKYGKDGDEKILLGMLMTDFHDSLDQFAIDNTFDGEEDDES